MKRLEVVHPARAARAVGALLLGYLRELDLRELGEGNDTVVVDVRRRDVFDPHLRLRVLKIVVIEVITALDSTSDGAQFRAGITNFVDNPNTVSGKEIVLRVELIGPDGEHGADERTVRVR